MRIKILTLILTTSTMAIAQQQEPSLKAMPPEILEQIGKRVSDQDKVALSKTGDQDLRMNEGALYNNQEYKMVNLMCIN